MMLRKICHFMLLMSLFAVGQSLPNILNFEMKELKEVKQMIKLSDTGSKFATSLKDVMLQYHLFGAKDNKANLMNQLKNMNMMKGFGNRVNGFQWKDCGGSAVKISNLNLSPDPIDFPGTLTVAADITINQTLASPLEAVVLFERKIGSSYVKIPCISDIGSCTYQDVCQILSNIVQCPDPLIEHGIPCQCPFKAGNLKLPSSDFEIDAAFLPGGDYHINGMLMSGSKKMACLDFFVSVSE